MKYTFNAVCYQNSTEVHTKLKDYLAQLMSLIELIATWHS